MFLDEPSPVLYAACRTFDAAFRTRSFAFEVLETGGLVEVVESCLRMGWMAESVDLRGMMDGWMNGWMDGWTDARN